MPEDDEMTLPCGCRIFMVMHQMVFEPHSDDCEWLEFVKNAATEAGKPITELEI